MSLFGVLKARVAWWTSWAVHSRIGRAGRPYLAGQLNCWPTLAKRQSCVALRTVLSQRTEMGVKLPVPALLLYVMPRLRLRLKLVGGTFPYADKPPRSYAGSATRSMVVVQVM